jgi:uncharacterized protein (TIGR02001 family)
LKTTRRLRWCAAWLGALSTSLAHAGGWGGGVGLTSDKISHGISQSRGHPSLSLDLNYRADAAWMATAGLATLDRGSRQHAQEVTLGIARAWQLDEDWLGQLGYAHYQYTGDAPAGLRHYEELNAALGWKGRVAASLSLSPDTYSWYRSGRPRAGPAATLELTLNQRLHGRLALQAGAGYQQLLDMGDWGYGYTSIGLNWGWGPVQVYLSHLDSQAGRRGLVPPGLAGERWVASLLWGF